MVWSFLTGTKLSKYINIANFCRFRPRHLSLPFYFNGRRPTLRAANPSWPASVSPPPPTMTDDNMHHTVRLRVEGMMCQKNCGKFRSIADQHMTCFISSFSIGSHEHKKTFPNIQPPLSPLPIPVAQDQRSSRHSRRYPGRPVRWQLMQRRQRS